jgi:hypothetical protein
MKQLAAILAYLFPMFVFIISFLLPIEAASYPDGLVSYWQFDNDTATDSVGTNHGTINGASWAEGLVGGALRFDGNNDIVTLPNISGYGDFTMSAWFKASSPDTTGPSFKLGWGIYCYQLWLTFLV